MASPDPSARSETADHAELWARFAPDRSVPPSGYALAATRSA